MGDIKKRKGKCLGSGVYQCVFLFFIFLRISVRLFWFHAGNGSSVCQRLTLHRERAGARGGRRGRKGGIKEDRADKHKSDFFFQKREFESERNLFLKKRQRITRETRREIRGSGGGDDGEGYK